MIRTPLHRYTPLRAKARLRPRARKAKRGVVRDSEYLAWLHTQPCFVCFLGYFASVPRPSWRQIGLTQAQRTRTEAHHVDRPTNDHRAVPLCAEHHRETRVSVHGGGGRRRFEERFGISFEAEVIRLNALYETERVLA